MKPFHFPGNEEISTACAQGEEEVLALFHRTMGQLAVQVQLLEDLVSKSSHALPDEIENSAEVPPDLAGRGGLPRQNVKTMQMAEGRIEIYQGDIFWVPVEESRGSEPGFTHPHVVIQDNIFNRSRIHTVVVCALTSNRKRANLPGNVSLEVGEANLTRQSVVEVSKISAIEKTKLGEYIGSLSQERINQILAGIRFLQWLTEPHD